MVLQTQVDSQQHPERSVNFLQLLLVSTVVQVVTASDCRWKRRRLSTPGGELPHNHPGQVVHVTSQPASHRSVFIWPDLD